MRVGKPLVSLPAQPEWDDVQLLWLRRVSTTRYPDLVGEAFAALHAEGGRVFCLGLHPWLIDMAHRVKYLDEALGRLGRHTGVWQATAGEIVERYRLAYA